MNDTKFPTSRGLSELTGIFSQCGIHNPCISSSYYDSQEVATNQNQDKEYMDNVNSVSDNSNISSFNDSGDSLIIEYPDSNQDSLHSEHMSIRSHAVEVLLKAYRVSERRSTNSVDTPAKPTSHKDRTFDTTVTSSLPSTQDGYTSSPIASTSSTQDGYSDSPIPSTLSHQVGNSLKSKSKLKFKLPLRRMKKKSRSMQLSSANCVTSRKEKGNRDLSSPSFEAEDYKGKHKIGCAYLSLPFVSEPFRDFFLPKPGFPCTCGTEKCSPLGSEEDLTDLRSMLRQWQVDFLTDLNITTPLDLIQAQRYNAKQVAFAMESWRAKKKMPDMETKSCMIALHIWAEATNEYLRAANTETENLDYPPLSEIQCSQGNGSSVDIRSSFGINSMIPKIH